MLASTAIVAVLPTVTTTVFATDEIPGPSMRKRALAGRQVEDAIGRDLKARSVPTLTVASPGAPTISTRPSLLRTKARLDSSRDRFSPTHGSDVASASPRCTSASG